MRHGWRHTAAKGEKADFDAHGPGMCWKQFMMCFYGTWFVAATHFQPFAKTWEISGPRGGRELPHSKCPGSMSPKVLRASAKLKCARSVREGDPFLVAGAPHGGRKRPHEVEVRTKRPRRRPISCRWRSSWRPQAAAWLLGSKLAILAAYVPHGGRRRLRGGRKLP